MHNARCLVGNEQTNEECPKQTIMSGNDTEDPAQKLVIRNMTKHESKSANKSSWSDWQMNEQKYKQSETVSIEDEQRSKGLTHERKKQPLKRKRKTQGEKNNVCTTTRQPQKRGQNDKQ